MKTAVRTCHAPSILLVARLHVDLCRRTSAACRRSL
ncbi:putative leader peptide [Streptomyces sp. 150FB]